MCILRRKKQAEETPAEVVKTTEEQQAEKVVHPMEVFLDISMVPIAPPKNTGVFRPEVLPEEFVLYREQPSVKKSNK